ncbi:MAG: phosphate acyltransferase PlsX [Candidatus Promineofilum sp.]|nr:phosphate acyltransferase PlsX [Promineifilum sp.]
MRIVVDAMGSDEHPGPDVAGAVMAARKFGDTIILVGDEPTVRAELSGHDTARLSIEVVHAAEAIGMKDAPAAAARDKRHSSMHVGMQLVRAGTADAFVSAGNTGGILAVATLRQTGFGRIPGILRPAMGVVFPIESKPMLIDNGANADARPEYLLQFGLMGSIYMARMQGIDRPRVALISNGEEEGKGNELIKETIPLMEASSLNYVGNIEPKEFVRGAAEVGVIDGFAGNVMMKTAEAVASYMSDMIRKYIMAGTLTKIGGALARPAFQRVRDQLNPDEVGGAPLLGVNGVVIIAHGRSNAYAIQQAIGQARRVVETGIVQAIAEGVSQENHH